MVNFDTGTENIDEFTMIPFNMVNPTVKKKWSGYKNCPKKITSTFKCMPK